MGQINHFRNAPAMSRTVSVHIQARRTFMKKPKQHKSVPNKTNQNDSGDKHDTSKHNGDKKDGRHKDNGKKREDSGRITSSVSKKKPVDESDEKWNPLRPYLNEECKRRQEMVRYLNYKDFAPATHVSRMKELHSHYNDNSFYHIHMLLMYQSNQRTSSYKRPQTRVGYVQKPTQKEAINHNPLRTHSRHMSPSCQSDVMNSRSSSSASQSERN